MTLAQTHDLDATLRTSNAITDAVQQLTKPRLIHTEIRAACRDCETNGDPEACRHNSGPITSIHTAQHKPLIDLLEDIDAMQSGGGRGGSSHTRTPFDIEAHELLKEIRGQVRQWLRQLHATTSRDLKGELTLWHTHYDNAVVRGILDLHAQREVLRKLDGWVTRIEAKYDPDEKREWMDPCPATIRNEAGDTHTCNALKVVVDGEQKSAIELNVTQLTARCRRCGTRWEGERGLIQLRYETNLRDLEEDAT